jgi:hypothetical protein
LKRAGPVPVGLPKVFPVFIGKSWAENPSDQAFIVAALQGMSGSTYAAATRLYYEMVCPAEFSAAPVHLNASGLLTYGGSAFYNPPEGTQLSDEGTPNFINTHTQPQRVKEREKEREIRTHTHRGTKRERGGGGEPRLRVPN